MKPFHVISVSGGRCGNMFLKRRQNVVDASSMRRRCVVDIAGAWRLVNAKNKKFINFTFWGERFREKSGIVSVGDICVDIRRGRSGVPGGGDGRDMRAMTLYMAF